MELSYREACPFPSKFLKTSLACFSFLCRLAADVGKSKAHLLDACFLKLNVRSRQTTEFRDAQLHVKEAVPIEGLILLEKTEHFCAGLWLGFSFQEEVNES